MGNVKENFKRSCLNGGMIAAVVIPLALFAESLYEGGLLQKTDVDILSAYALPMALSNYLQFETVMSRAFMSSEYADAYCDSSEFTFAVIQKKEWLQNRYLANTAEYLWTIKLIDWHEKLGFVMWKSENNMEGLECNKGISWTSEVFEHYKDSSFSVKGLKHISKSITDNVLIDLNPEFKWIWSVLSGRDIITNDVDFIERHVSELSLGINCSRSSNYSIQ